LEKPTDLSQSELNAQDAGHQHREEVMLKLTYTEVGLDLEKITGSIEKLITRRTIVAVRIGQSILVQPGSASFLIPTNALNLKAFKTVIKNEPNRTIDLCKVDDEYYEVSIRGTWIANNNEAHTGIFVAVMGDRAESFVEQLWQTTQDVVLV
jgi:hypothetical protein